jgi:hypothetical protein
MPHLYVNIFFSYLWKQSTVSSYCFKMQFFHIKFSRRNGAIQFIIAGKIALLQYDKDDIYKLNFRTERQDLSKGYRVHDILRKI